MDLASVFDTVLETELLTSTIVVEKDGLYC